MTSNQGIMKKESLIQRNDELFHARKALLNISFALNNSRTDADALHTIGNEVSWVLAQQQASEIQVTAGDAPPRKDEDSRPTVAKSPTPTLQPVEWTETDAFCLSRDFEEWALLPFRLSIEKDGDGEYEDAQTRWMFKCFEVGYKKGMWGAARHINDNIADDLVKANQEIESLLREPEREMRCQAGQTILSPPGAPDNLTIPHAEEIGNDD